MIYQDTIVPALSIKKVHVSSRRNHISVDFALRPSSRESIMQMFGNNELSETVRIYFVILDDTSAPAVQSLAYTISSRNQAMKSILFHGGYNLMNKHAVASVSLGDVMRNQTTLEQTEGNLNDDFYNEMYSNIIIDYNPGTPYRLMETNNLHLVAFVGLEIFPDQNAFDFGGPTSYELLLDKSINGRILSPPMFRKIFYISDQQDPAYLANLGFRASQPYSGIYHYHGEENPGAGGYIGYMAGHARGEMGPKLEVREARNYKITSDMLDMANPDLLTSALEDQSSEDVREVMNYESLRFSTSNVERFLRSKMRDQLRARPGIIDYGSRETAHIRVAEGSEISSNSGRNYYGYILGIDFLQALFYHSRFGALMEYHYDKGNFEFINTALFYSQVMKLKIFRKRMTETPEDINLVHSKKYHTIDKNQIKALVVESSDQTPPRLAPIEGINQDSHRSRMTTVTTPRGSIEEVEVVALTVGEDSSVLDPTDLTPHSRQFFVRDFDLFNNTRYGNYSYDFEIIMNDGVVGYIKDTMQTCRNAISRLDALISAAQIPQRVTSTGPIVRSGNYNYVTKQFSQEFLEDAENIATLQFCYNSYVHLRSFITGTSLGLAGQLGHLFEMQQITIESLNEIRTAMKNLLTSAREVFDLADSSDKRLLDLSLSVHQSKIKTVDKDVDNVILVKADTGVTFKSFGPSTLLADYEVAPFQGPFGYLESDLLSTLLSRDDLLESDSRYESLVMSPRQFMQVSVESSAQPQSEDDSSRRSILSAGSLRVNQLPISVTDRNSNQITTVNTVITRQEYSVSNESTKKKTDVAVDLLSNPEMEAYQLQPKGLGYLNAAARRLQSGITIRAGNSNIEGFGGIGIDRVIIDEGSESQSIDIPGIESALCDIANISEDEDQFSQQVMELYGHLNLVVTELPNIYRALHRLGNTEVNMARRVLSEKDIFLSRSISIEEQFRRRVEVEGGCFFKHARPMEFITTTEVSQPLLDKRIVISKREDNTRRKVAILRAAPTHNSDQGQAVNNLLLIEV